MQIEKQLDLSNSLIEAYAYFSTPVLNPPTLNESKIAILSSMLNNPFPAHALRL